MNQGETESLLVVLGRTIKFASDHPYLATGVFGAAVGSVATYKVLTLTTMRERVSEVLAPKIYEFGLTPNDLQQMQVDPTVELRWELPGIVVVITPEKRERPKALPDIVVEPDDV